MQSVRLKCEPLQSLAFGSISGTYALVGTLNNPAQIFWVQNLTNSLITFSFDASTDNFVLPSGAFVLLDVGSNRAIDETLSFPSGLKLYAKGSPASGSVYLTTFYMG